MEKKICYIALSDSSYPRKLLFHYLQDLQKELDNFEEKSTIQTISKPYSFVRFGKIIGRIRKQYMDTRTQANLSKLNASRKQELYVVTEHLNNLIQRRQLLGICSWLFFPWYFEFFFLYPLFFKKNLHLKYFCIPRNIRNSVFGSSNVRFNLLEFTMSSGIYGKSSQAWFIKLIRTKLSHFQFNVLKGFNLVFS